MAEDHRVAITALEEQLRHTPRELAPYEHALLAHRLGICHAESGGPPAERVRQALEYFDQAASLLDPTFHPVEHARVLTAAGAVQRTMGAPKKALTLFQRAEAMAADRVGPDESAAMCNNVGLALLDLGAASQAVHRFGLSLERFGTDTAEGRRGRAAALHNRGLASSASGKPADLATAMADYDQALLEVPFAEAPLHHGLVQHSRGIAAGALADIAADAESCARWRLVAIDAFTLALDVFVWPTHATQHGMANFNAGRMWARGGSTDDVRRAQLCFEDAVTAFDPRHQAAAWGEAYAELEAVDARLAADHFGWSRADHLVALLVADSSAAERIVRSRLTRWLALPLRARAAALASFASAAFHRDEDAGSRALVALLAAAMEMPLTAQQAVLDAMLVVRAQIRDDAQRSHADTLLELMIGEAVVGPQRMFVRDHLVAGGFERP